MRYVRQEGIRDCGVCCLYNIIRYYGGNIDIEKLRKLTNTNENGTSIYNIVNTANKLGFKSKAYKCNINDLHSLTFPLILYIKLKEFNHFVILEKIDIDKITIFDPIRGRINYSIQEFIDVWQNIVISFEKNGNIVKELNFYDNYLINIFNNNKKQIISIIILSLLCALLSILLSLLIKNVYDLKLTSNSFLLFLFLVLFKSLIEFYKNKISISLNNNLDYSISKEIYEKIFSLPLFYHHSRPVGDITSKINDIYSLENFFSLVTLSSVLDILSVIFVLFTTIIINFRFFITILIITILYFVIYYYSRNEEKNDLYDVKEKETYNNSMLVENIIGIDTINNLNLQEKRIIKQNDAKNSSLKSYSKYMHFISLQSLLFNFIESYGIFVIMFIGSYLINKNKISIGDLSIIYSLFMLYFSSIKNILSLDKSYINSKLAYRRIHTFLNIKDKYIGNKTIKSIDKIVFKDISFSYDNNRIISKFNLEINKGDYILLYGQSGAGKSTLLKLLNKDLLLKEGNIYLNNEDIRDIKITSLRNNICYVSQNEYIFTDSIKNNIVLNRSMKKQELEKALRVTMVDKILKKRNINLDYLLEENGHNLSAGERQKILLARTLLRNTDFIILDETMNEIDIESERKILERIKTEYNKTLILVSHRNSNIDLFNKRVTI